jgi:hypothetical protein
VDPLSEFAERRQSAARFATTHTAAEAAEVFNLGVGSVNYWKRKDRNPALHSQEWGGKRNTKFTLEQQGQYESALLEEIEISHNSITVILFFFCLHYFQQVLTPFSAMNFLLPYKSVALMLIRNTFL